MEYDFWNYCRYEEQLQQLLPAMLDRHMASNTLFNN